MNYRTRAFRTATNIEIKRMLLPFESVCQRTKIRLPSLALLWEDSCPRPGEEKEKDKEVY